MKEPLNAKISLKRSGQLPPNYKTEVSAENINSYKFTNNENKKSA